MKYSFPLTVLLKRASCKKKLAVVFVIVW